MSNPNEVEIWSKETGITDLPEDWSSLAVPEMRRVETEWKRKRDQAIGTSQLEEFTQQLHREWAIETGQIENLYDIERGITMALIEQGFHAALLEHGSVNKDPEYVLNLINDQKDALEGLFAFVKQDRQLSTSYIKELHAAMTKSQSSVTARDHQGNIIEVPMIHGEYKSLSNFPERDGKVYQYCPPEHTSSEMDMLVNLHLEHIEKGVAPEVEAAWLHHRFTQIHPFQDGNGRVARAIASLVLIRANLFPLTIPREEKSVYLQALEKSDAGTLRPLVLTIARRQQASFGRASDLLIKFAPDATTPQEAAKLLADSILNRTSSKEARTNVRIREVGRLLTNGFSMKFSEVQGQIANAYPGAGHTGWRQYENGTNDLFGDLWNDQRQTRLKESIFHYYAGFGLDVDVQLILAVGSIEFDFEEQVIGICFYTFNEKSVQLGKEIIFEPNEATDGINFDVNSWLDDVITIFLNHVRKIL